MWNDAKMGGLSTRDYDCGFDCEFTELMEDFANTIIAAIGGNDSLSVSQQKVAVIDTSAEMLAKLIFGLDTDEKEDILFAVTSKAKLFSEGLELTYDIKADKRYADIREKPFIWWHKEQCCEKLSSQLQEAAGNIYAIEGELSATHPLYKEVNKLLEHTTNVAELFEKHTKERGED